MQSHLALLVFICGLSAMFCALARAIYMAREMRSVRATVITHDYHPAERTQDAAKWRSVDSDYTKPVSVVLSFEDEMGRTIKVPHILAIQLGRTPNTTYEIWHKRDNPNAVTLNGPINWALAALVAAPFVVGPFYAGLLSFT
jgi:hypothetical protein